MQQTNTQPSADRPRKRSKADTRSFERRLKAAGLDNENMPDDIDEFRCDLARRIHMLVNEWHGCPELLCQRNRGCMAPNIVCANAEQPPPGKMERDWPKVQAEVYRALKEHLAARGLENE
jgi:hypothetical protein